MSEKSDTPVYLISGAGTAAGHLVVQRLLAYDVRLVLLSRYGDLEKTIQKTATYNAERMLFFRMDPSRASWLKLIARSVAERWGPIDGIVSIADFEGGSSIKKLSHHQLQMQLRRNLFAPAALVHAMLPVFTPQPLIVRAPSADHASPGSAISTEGLRGFARSLESEMPSARVRFLEPGDAAQMADGIMDLIASRLNAGL
ncbi:MAG: hypothetical protein CVV45_03050 [Spirochaetae bacterium HGW-Spirochaetae-10]|nr:MAG: hypothetical protein CVV45_03050 [Spirochaetae bacterium HGW-Spirochaetae-10]